MQSIYITRDEHGFTVCVDNKIADCLGPDEVLGTVAEALYLGTARYTKSLQQSRTHERGVGARLEREKIERRFPQIIRDLVAEEHAEHIKDANQ